MMLFVLRMIGVLEMRNIVTIADFKTYMNLGINDCFRFGYPNFNSLIQSFSDVFLLSAGVSELSEVILNKQSICELNNMHIPFEWSYNFKCISGAKWRAKFLSRRRRRCKRSIQSRHCKTDSAAISTLDIF